MNNNANRPQLSEKECSEIIAQFQQTNPQIYARLQTVRPELFETGNEEVLAMMLSAAASAGRQGGHGHSHNHSSSCQHSHSTGHFSQPVPEPPPKPDPMSMNVVQAVQYNELDRVKQLIESGETQVNKPDDEGCYLIHWAAINNHVELIRYLIARGATIDIKGGALQSTPLHWACRQGCTEAFFLLVDNGAAIDSTDVNGLQSIHLASQYGQIKILAYLLGSGLDVDTRDNRGFTPLIYSCLGPPPDYSPSSESTHICCTQFLLTFGANVNYQEPTRSYTPLHFAINNQNPVSFSVLLKSPQINIHLKNSDNYDVLTFARVRHTLDFVNALEERIKSTKVNIKPRFLQYFLTNENIRKWLMRGLMFFFMTLIGLSANAYEHSIWSRILIPIVLIVVLIQLFNYYVFDLNTLGNFAFSYVLSSTILMYVTYWIYLQNHSWTFAHVCYHFFTCYGLYCVRCLKKLNPGFLKQQTMIMDGNSLTKEKICILFARDPRWTLEHFCVTCLIRRPLRSKHCPVDASCVSKFDHHCAWLDACIGGRNYFYFFRLLTCGTIALWIWTYQACRLLFADLEQFTVKYLFLEVYDPWFTYMLILTTFNTFWVTMMTGFHWINSVYLGVTLNERLTGYRYSYFRDPNTGKFRNLFKKHLLKNLLESFGFSRVMALCRYTRIDWSQIYDIEQIDGIKIY